MKFSTLKPYFIPVSLGLTAAFAVSMGADQAYDWWKEHQEKEQIRELVMSGQLCLAPESPLYAEFFPDAASVSSEGPSHVQHHEDHDISGNLVPNCFASAAAFESGNQESWRDTDFLQFAADVTEYAKTAAAPYENARNLEELQAIFEQIGPDKIEINDERQLIVARWGYENSGGEFTLHNDEAPAYIAVDLTRGIYSEFWYQDGVTSRDNDFSYTRYSFESGNIFQGWSGQNGFSREDGPSQIIIRPAHQDLRLFWTVNDEPKLVNGSPTEAYINTDTGMIYREEYAEVVADHMLLMHRHEDRLHMIDRDEVTGALTRTLNRFHGSSIEDDQITKECFYDPENGDLLEEKWQLNDEDIPRPEVFEIPHHEGMH